MSSAHQNCARTSATKRWGPETPGTWPATGTGQMTTSSAAHRSHGFHRWFTGQQATSPRLSCTMGLPKPCGIRSTPLSSLIRRKTHRRKWRVGFAASNDISSITGCFRSLKIVWNNSALCKFRFYIFLTPWI